MTWSCPLAEGQPGDARDDRSVTEAVAPADLIVGDPGVEQCRVDPRGNQLQPGAVADGLLEEIHGPPGYPHEQGGAPAERRQGPPRHRDLGGPDLHAVSECRERNPGSLSDGPSHQRQGHGRSEEHDVGVRLPDEVDHPVHHARGGIHAVRRPSHDRMGESGVVGLGAGPVRGEHGDLPSREAADQVGHVVVDPPHPGWEVVGDDQEVHGLALDPGASLPAQGRVTLGLAARMILAGARQGRASARASHRNQPGLRMNPATAAATSSAGFVGVMMISRPR
jgi:hypothetical protein